MAERLIGIETEYAISSGAQDEYGFETKDLLYALLQVAKRQLAYLPDFGDGLFLGNGSRFYVDYGLHPELATPECSDPWEVVRYILAGERILKEMITELEAGNSCYKHLNLWKCNVDYSGAGTTWGCHESYLHRMNQMELSNQIIPHLVSRIIYTGAGGFDSRSPGLKFTLSPRVPHLTGVISSSSVSARGIFHSKDEALAGDGYHRLHLICGESLCSETAMWLKVATTALVVAMAEAGLHLSNAVQLSDPLKAMQDFAFDTECKATAELANGKPITAIEIQRHYLGRAEAHVSDSFMPRWAKEACRQWRAILARLEDGSEGTNTTLDWAIKHALYADYARRQGIAWDTLPLWTHAQNSLWSALTRAGYNDCAVSVDFILNQNSPVRETVQQLSLFLNEKGLRWDDLDRFLRLRKQLFEADTRFGQLAGGGIFAELERREVLDHKVAGVGDVGRGTTYPPETTRARLRGDFIRRSAGDRHRYQCDWQGVWDYQENRMLDLYDPFATEEQWHEFNNSEVKADSYASRSDQMPAWY